MCYGAVMGQALAALSNLCLDVEARLLIVKEGTLDQVHWTATHRVMIALQLASTTLLLFATLSPFVCVNCVCVL